MLLMLIILGLTYVEKSLKDVVEGFRELKKMSKCMKWLLGLVTIFSYVFLALVITQTYEMSKSGKYTVEDVADLKHRMRYVLTHALAGAIWPILCTYGVTGMREVTANLPLIIREYFVMNYVNIVRNSLEDLILSTIIQLVLVIFLNAEQTLDYISALLTLYFFGRFPVWLNNLQYRTFGFITSVGPAITTLLYTIYNLWFSPYVCHYKHLLLNESSMSF